MNETNFNEFYPQLAQKGYTHKEVTTSKTVAEVPQFYLNRYPNATYNEYAEHLSDYLNGL